MGKAPFGPYGPIIGKVGNLVYYRVNGRNRVRTIGKVTVPPSPAQLRARQEMKVISQFLKALTELLNIGFRSVAKGQASAYNCATAFNKRCALTGEYPDISIDYSKVVISLGQLDPPEDAEMELTAEGLRFSWNNSFPTFYPRPDDQTILLAYFPDQKRGVYEVYGPKRSAGSAILVLPDDLATQPMVVYMGFVSANGEKVSDSRYLGRVN